VPQQSTCIYLSLVYFGASRSSNPIINHCTEMKRNNFGGLCFGSIGERQVVHAPFLRSDGIAQFL